MQTQNWGVEGGWVGEAELDDVVPGSGQQRLRLVLVLKHRLLAAVLLLLPRQRLLLLCLLQQSTDHPSSSKKKTPHLSHGYIPAAVNGSSLIFKAKKPTSFSWLHSCSSQQLILVFKAKNTSF